MRSQREEIIDNLVKDLSPKDKQKMRDFWNGRKSLTGNEFTKFAAIIEEFNKTMKQDSSLEEFLKDYKKPY